jgi:hypothetical protein
MRKPLLVSLTYLFMPRPLRVVEVVTVMVAFTLLVVASLLIQDGWFHTLCQFGFYGSQLYLMACMVASVHRTNWWVRRVRSIGLEVDVLIGEGQLAFMNGEAAKVKQLDARTRVLLDEMRAVVAEWKAEV